jgi:hypothetical protein
VRLLVFLATHSDLIVLLIRALDGGASKEALKRAIQREMVAASDAAMRAELGAEE